jgi:hypothetical protein
MGRGRTRGHLPAFARPKELAERLEGYGKELVP